MQHRGAISVLEWVGSPGGGRYRATYTSSQPEISVCLSYLQYHSATSTLRWIFRQQHFNRTKITKIARCKRYLNLPFSEVRSINFHAIIFLSIIACSNHLQHYFYSWHHEHHYLPLIKLGIIMAIKITRETPEVHSDKRKPRMLFKHTISQNIIEHQRTS